MSQTASIQGQSAGPIALAKLSPKILLSIYGIIPVLCLFVAIDYFFFDLHFSHNLPEDRKFLALESLIFQEPHAIASILTFMDKEYIAGYRKKMTGPLIILLLATAFLPWAIGQAWFIFALVVYNIYHQVSQQVGVASILAKSKSRAHTIWRWSSFALVLLSILTFLAGTDSEGHQNLGKAFFTVSHYLISGILVLSLVTAFMTARQSKTAIGAAYIAATALMIFVYYGFYLMGLPLLMIFVSRFTHDGTALAFYINHNTNRNRNEPKNVISGLRKYIPIPEYILTPMMGILLMLALLPLQADVFLFVGLMINLVHFYFEGVMWKGGSLHRANIYV